MSSGAFADSKYETNEGNIHLIRIQSETASAVLAGATNTAPADPIDTETRALARGGKRRVGVIARTVTLKPVGDSPDGYLPGGRLVVPVLDPVVWAGAKPGRTAMYLGKPYLIAGRSPERIR